MVVHQLVRLLLCGWMFHISSASILKELCLALSCNNLTILVDSLHSDDMFCAGPMYL